MRVLGIESSCDETAAAIVEDGGRVIADVVASQVAVHAPYGGVVPELASRAHLANVAPVIAKALEAVPGGLDAIDGIAVTRGPGLLGALLVGMSAGKAMAWSRNLPIVYVDHLVAHLLAVYLQRDLQPGQEVATPEMPFVALLASGGHTAIYEVRAHDDVELIGQTRDDAAGEAFDKAAKLLGLGYPGGPVIDRLAKLGDRSKVELPLPMPSTKRLDFSFSGLKTAIARHVEKHGAPKDERELADVCAAFQHAVVEVLARKSVAACKQRRIPRLVLAGGVAANAGLRARTTQLATSVGVKVFVPPIASCTDNAAMIAYAGYLRLARGERDALDVTAYSKSPDLRRGKILER
ncbi:tRNA (adenosine(37)-N6)-threonylcarbamoyltransferase complex transferase subunit TsaD [Sandaracinus amylolyticus]|uniref:tRNA N6-adenosine threonylcarbamoyltransferase n=1 Tax=Sandaracinus amylolyticus TaxID=927083 RepID=A0A0F6SE65_9BACT|nr:tRNA (adenosine(37)-N6)-threonylcarbamoyltransferase complex transferase subunit TsaD [Sandaracinus amylolyticus]AKF04654.1 TsaD/Kae1/Qri7 protein, required for threonylcarbamoyladenosine t(6)A37 formation in tRNA [Sandaracinus amylolyticus]